MILRHITKIKYLPNIINENCLNPRYNPKEASSDKEYISFEIYQQNDSLLKCYSHFKRIKEEETFQLFFDTDMMIKDKINVVSEFYNGGKHTKLELQLCVPNIISQEEYNSIGEYRFVHGVVSLRYLTDESKFNLEKWKSEYYMDQLRKSIQCQVTIGRADSYKYDGIEKRLEELNKEINTTLQNLKNIKKSI